MMSFVYVFCIYLRYQHIYLVTFFIFMSVHLSRKFFTIFSAQKLKNHFHAWCVKEGERESSTRCSTRINDLARDKRGGGELFTMSVGICLCRFFRLARFTPMWCMCDAVNIDIFHSLSFYFFFCYMSQFAFITHWKENELNKMGMIER